MNNSVNYQIKEVVSAKEMISCFEIRAKVFIEEEKVSPEEEIDGRDQDARHFLIYKDNKPIGTLRLFTDSKTESFHLGRVAVFKEERGKEAGYQLVSFLLDYLRKDYQGYTVFLESQTHAVGFYEKLGFEVTDHNAFLDAGIPHLKMALKL